MLQQTSDMPAHKFQPFLLMVPIHMDNMFLKAVKSN